LIAREFLVGAYLQKGDVDRYLAETIKHAESYGVPPEALEPLRHAYAGGRAGVLQFMLEHAQKPGLPSVQLAMLYGEAGNLDAAFEHLHRAIDSRDPILVHLAVAPQWDSLRPDPRFGECLARMGL
jgi:hypothetical protein